MTTTEVTPFSATVDFTDAGEFYTGSAELLSLADADIVHPEGVALPVHSQVRVPRASVPSVYACQKASLSFTGAELLAAAPRCPAS